MSGRQRQVLRVPEIADQLGVSEDTVRRMIRRGELPAKRWGGSGSPSSRSPWWISQRDLDRWLDRLPTS